MTECGQGFLAEIFIVTKLGIPDHHRVKEVIEALLKKLNVAYIGLWLMHAPCASINSASIDLFHV